MIITLGHKADNDKVEKPGDLDLIDNGFWRKTHWRGHIKIQKSSSLYSYTIVVVLFSTRHMSRNVSIFMFAVFLSIMRIKKKKDSSDEEIMKLSRSDERNKKLNQAQSSLKRREDEEKHSWR